MRSARWLPAMALAGAIFALPVHAEWPYFGPSLKTGRVALHKVVILPAQFAYKVIGLKGVKGGTEEGEQIGVNLASAVAAELARRGVEILPSPRDAAKTDSEKYAIADLETRYDTVGLLIRKKPGLIREGRLTLDDRVAGFAPGTGADALVFLRGHGEARQPIGAFGTADLHIDVAFVGAKTGEVLGLVRFGIYLSHKEIENRLASGFREALHDLPLPLPPPKH